MRPALALLLLALPAAAAPRLPDRPLAPYERQVAEGVRVFGGPFGWVVVAKVGTDEGPQFCRVRADKPDAVWETTVPRWHVAEWLRDYPENRCRRPK